jgi:protein phosphatase 1G
MQSLIGATHCFLTGDMEFKQNKFLPSEKQIVTASPDVNTVELCDDDDFLVLACDGIW